MWFVSMIFFIFVGFILAVIMWKVLMYIFDECKEDENQKIRQEAFLRDGARRLNEAILIERKKMTLRLSALEKFEKGEEPTNLDFNSKNFSIKNRTIASKKVFIIFLLLTLTAFGYGLFQFMPQIIPQINSILNK